MKTTISFTPELIQNGQRIIVYGASVYGEIAYNLLKCAGLSPDYYCDRSIEADSFMGIPVIRPDELKYFTNDWILIASADFFHEIRFTIEGYKCNWIGDLQAMFERYPIKISDLSKRAKGIYVNKQNYIDVVNQEQTADALNFTRVQFVVSERCSLKCRDCLHLMQYYENPQNIDLEKYRNSFERLLSVANNISEIRILGGEPFMNPDMYKIVKWWHDEPNINEFVIYTNGTIVPSEEILNELSRPKVRIYISDYKINNNSIRMLTDKLKQHDMDYYVSPYEGWADAGELRFRNHSVKENTNIFSKCHARNCITFMYGQIHRCARSAHAMNLGAMPDVPDDYIDIYNFSDSDEKLKLAIKRFQEKEWIEACNYCSGADLHAPLIPAGIQVNKPLLYNRVK